MKDKKIDFHALLDPEYFKKAVDAEKQREFLGHAELLIYFLDGKTLNADAESCKQCPLYSGLSAGKVLCVLKLENKQPLIKYRSLVEAQACSMTSTLITLERKGELVNDLKNANNRAEYSKEALEKARRDIDADLETLRKQKDAEIDDLKRPMEEVLTESNTLKSRCAALQTELRNAFVGRSEEIAILEMDNAQLRQQVEEMSHDPIVEKSSFLTVQVAEKEKIIADLKLENSRLDTLLKLFRAGSSV